MYSCLTLKKMKKRKFLSRKKEVRDGTFNLKYNMPTLYLGGLEKDCLVIWKKRTVGK